MLYATNRFAGDGTTSQYEINFVGGYLDRAHVKAYIEGADLSRTEVPLTSSNFVGPYTLAGLPVTPIGSTLVIYRDTPKAPLVDFVNGSRLTERNLDTASQQGLLVAVEGADAVSPTGLAGVVDQVTNAATAALVAASEAEVNAELAGISRDRAVIAEGTSQVNAAQTAGDRVATGLDRVASSESAAAASAAAGVAVAAANTAMAAAAPSDNVLLIYDTLASAQAALPLAADTLVEVSQDETHAGARTRYKVQAGALVFAANLDQWIGEQAATPLEFMSAAMRADALSGAPMLDHSAALQAAFDSGKIVLIDEIYLTSGNQVPSGAHLVFRGKGQLKLTNGANRPILQNTNWNKASWGGSTYGIDKDITIEGLNIDGNQANQVHHLTTGPYAGEYVSGVRFFGVKNLAMTRTTINNARTFGLWLCAIDGLIFDGAYFNQYMGGTPDNQDGLHINGPARNLFIRNLYGYTNDDLLALNADDGPLGANVTAGAITDVVVDGVAGIGALNGIRMLSATSRIDRVQINNVTGSYRDPAINLSAFGLGTGNFGAVSIDGVDVACSNAYNGAGSDYYGVVVLDDAIGTVSITNIKRSNAADNRPLIDVRPGAVIRQLLIDGVGLYTAAGGVSAETVVNVKGTVSVLCLRNLDWHRDASVARGGRVVYGNGGTVGQLNASGWSTRRLGNLVELSSGAIDPIRLADVLDADSDPSGAVILLANGAATGVYTTGIRTDTGRRTVKATGGATVWPGSMIGSASGAGAYLSANQSIGAAYSVGAFDTAAYDRAQEYSTSTRKFTNTTGQGLYDITVLAGVTVPTANTTIVIALFKNGAALRYMYGNAHSADCNITTTCRVLLEDSDVIDVRFYSSNATTLQAGQARTSISISRAI